MLPRLDSRLRRGGGGGGAIPPNAPAGRLSRFCDLRDDPEGFLTRGRGGGETGVSPVIAVLMLDGLSAFGVGTLFAGPVCIMGDRIEPLRLPRLTGGAGGVFELPVLVRCPPVIGAADGECIGGGTFVIDSPARPGLGGSRWLFLLATGGVGPRLGVGVLEGEVMPKGLGIGTVFVK